MFKATLSKLNIAVDTVFGKVQFGKPNFDFVNELKYNNAVFSAFKTHRQQNDLAKLLLDTDGNLKPFAQFKKDTEQIIGKYNINWLNTEYNTAVIRARQAANFKKFQQDADLYPNLKWLPSTSVEKRKSHVPFYNLVKPINDTFWRDNFPGNLWNCKCGITNTDEPVNDSNRNIGNPKNLADEGLEGNPAFTKKIFSDNNAYRKNGYVNPNNLDDIANKEARKFYLSEIIADAKKYKKTIHPFNGKNIKSENLATGNLLILRRSVDDIMGHVTELKLKRYALHFEKDIKNWRYLGWRLADKKKHPEAEYFLYYSTFIDGEEKFINIKYHTNFKTEVIYCLLNSIKDTNLNKGIPPGLMRK